MYLFPERSYRSGRRLLVAAIVLSLLIHGAGGVIWQLWHHRTGMAAAAQTPEVPVLADAITIERRAVPRQSHRARSRRPLDTPARASAARPAPALAMPTLPPLERTVPVQPAPLPRPERVVVHRAPRVVAVVARPEPTVEPARGAFSSQQIAQLDAQFKRTIDAAQRAVSEPPQTGGASEVGPQREPPAADRRRYQQIMSGTPQEVLSSITGAGDCTVLDGPRPSGGLRAYYIRCTIHYSDGYFEQVSFPWPFQFTPRKDPFDYRVNPDGLMTFPGQAPPDGFTLPSNFALSRAVCAFFKPQCQAIINAEINRGDPAYGKPP